MEIKRYRATVEYDGTDFCGFQRQAQGERTVQETLERAIQKVSQQKVTVIGAGRTDTGVHARGQVIAFEATWSHGQAAMCRALNANLPPDVAVRDLAIAKSGFHPRFDARRRTYQYLINNDTVPSPIMRRTSWHRPRPLEVARMNQASALLVGEHDFATFGQPPVGHNTVRTVYGAEWQRKGRLLTFSINANAFLYRMVRSLAGSLLLVGEGAWSVEQFAESFAAADRTLAGPTAPPEGVCLAAVSYED